ncbi:MAG: hypothetical protein LBB23_03810 [Rickettsiales bacterium]|jgi:hypothetical protein|nr:hypothetical protein [Rickettsiales bacterium]
MIPSSIHIDTVLQGLNTRFARYADAIGTNNTILNLVSKLSCVEFFGWLECSLDEIYIEIADKITDVSSKNIALKRIEDLNSFRRDRFESMLGILGIVFLEQEYNKLSSIEKGYFDLFRQRLSEFPDIRNHHAHNHIIEPYKKKTVNIFKPPSELQKLRVEIDKGFIVLDKMLKSAGII